jgi:hypothetical protein
MAVVRAADAGNKRQPLAWTQVKLQDGRKREPQGLTLGSTGQSTLTGLTSVNRCDLVHLDVAVPSLSV